MINPQPQSFAVTTAALGSHNSFTSRLAYSLISVLRRPTRASRSGLMFFVLCTVLGPTFVVAHERLEEMNQLDESEKLAGAEAACDRAIARLNETMDFQAVFDEMWVSDQSLKERFFEHDFEEDKNDIPYDPALARQAVIGTLNLMYLLFKYERDHERPAELQRMLTSLDKAHTRLRSHHESRAAALKNLEQYVREARGVNSFLRDRLMSKPRETPSDKTQTGEDLGHKDKAEVLHGYAQLGIGKQTPVYAIVRSAVGLRWIFIEENGSYRLIEIHWELGGMGYL